MSAKDIVDLIGGVISLLYALAGLYQGLMKRDYALAAFLMATAAWLNP